MVTTMNLVSGRRFSAPGFNGARYNPWSGAYARGGAVNGPCGGLDYASRYNPRTGIYTRSPAAWGPGGAREAFRAWTPRISGSGTRPDIDVLHQWVPSARVSNGATGAASRAM